MRVAVVTPFHAEPIEQLAQCMGSVSAQIHDAEHEIEHILVADGAHPSRAWEAMHLETAGAAHTPRPVLQLPDAHRDFGNCARAVGALDAVSRGFDAVCFLDADNWLEPEHVQAMIGHARRTSSDVCTARRWICRVDGSKLYPDEESDGENHVDTSCMFFLRGAFFLLPLWGLIPQSHAAIGDRVFWAMVKGSRVAREHYSEKETVCYRTRYAVHYRIIGEEPPPGCKEVSPVKQGIALCPVQMFVPTQFVGM